MTRSELDEKKARMAELEQQVAELTMQTEYQLRLKDLHLTERLKDLTEKFTMELEADRQKFDLLLTEKNEQEMEYEEKLKQVGAGAGGGQGFRVLGLSVEQGDTNCARRGPNIMAMWALGYVPAHMSVSPHCLPNTSGAAGTMEGPKPSA